MKKQLTLALIAMFIGTGAFAQDAAKPSAKDHAISPTQGKAAVPVQKAKGRPKPLPMPKPAPAPTPAPAPEVKKGQPSRAIKPLKGPVSHNTPAAPAPKPENPAMKPAKPATAPTPKK